MSRFLFLWRRPAVRRPEEAGEWVHSSDCADKEHPGTLPHMEVSSEGLNQTHGSHQPGAVPARPSPVSWANWTPTRQKERLLSDLKCSRRSSVPLSDGMKEGLGRFVTLTVQPWHFPRILSLLIKEQIYLGPLSFLMGAHPSSDV